MPTLDVGLLADSDPVIAAVYQKFRVLMPALPENYHEGLVDWRLFRTTSEVVPVTLAEEIPVKIKVDLTFSNGLEYHGRIRESDGELE